jgi:hypothetical protein
MFDLPPPDPQMEIVIANEGVTKGLQESDGPQVKGKLALMFGDVIIGTELKNQDGDAALEGKAFIGASKTVAGFRFSGEAAYKTNLDTIDPMGDNEAFEATVGVNRDFGRFGLGLAHTYSPDDLGRTGESHFSSVSVSYDAGALDFSGEVGRRERDGGLDYTAFNAGASLEVAPNVSLDARYYGTSRSNLGEEFGDRAVFSLRTKF